MNWCMRMGLVLGILACLGLANQGTQPTRAGEAAQELVGKPAPDVGGEFAINGQPIRLKDLKGKVVLVDFWAIWCGPCIATFPHLREWHDKYADKGLVIVGATTYYKAFDWDKEKGKLKPLYEIDPKTKKIIRDPDTGAVKLIGGGLKPAQEQEMLKEFVAHHKLKHLILVAPEAEHQETFKAYNGRGIPHAVVIDRKGTVRLVRIGSGEANAKAIESEIKKLLEEK